LRRLLQRHVLRPPPEPDPPGPLHAHGRRLGDTAAARPRARLDHRAAGGARQRPTTRAGHRPLQGQCARALLARVVRRAGGRCGCAAIVGGVASAARRDPAPAARAPCLGCRRGRRDARAAPHLSRRRRGPAARARSRGVTVGELDAAPGAQARELLTACCGAAPWVDAMLAARPYGDRERLFAAADRAWASLTGAQLGDAIARHPRLGESRARATLSAREQAWSAGEQSGVEGADDAARNDLARGNEAYERRFGHTFILCATGLGPQAL